MRCPAALPVVGLVLASAALAGPPARPALAGPPARPAPAGAAEDALRAFQRAYAEKDPGVRKKAVGLLEDIPGPAATAALLPALSDEASPVRERARDVLLRRVDDADLAAIA